MNITWQLIEQVGALARHAGRQILLPLLDTHLDRTQKDQAGFVTKADLASEAYIVQQLSLLPIKAGIWAEERGKDSALHEYWWVIDPLDGTTNFAQGIGYFCVSIALVDSKQVLLGVIYNPIRDELFAAGAHLGARLNGKALFVEKRGTIKDAIIAIAAPYSCENHFADCLGKLAQLRDRGFYVREMGSAALQLAEAAAGRFDGFYSHGLFWWDNAAATLIAQQAGIMVTDKDGKTIDASSGSVLAGSAEIHAVLRTVFAARE